MAPFTNMVSSTAGALKSMNGYVIYQAGDYLSMLG